MTALGPVMMTLSTSTGAATVKVVAHKVAVAAATAAQWLWNAAMTANPIGIVATAIGGLTAGIIALSSRTGGASEDWKEFSNTISQNANQMKNDVESAFEGMASKARFAADEAKLAIDSQFSQYKTSIEQAIADTNTLYGVLEEQAETAGMSLMDIAKQTADTRIDEITRATDKEKAKIREAADADIAAMTDRMSFYADAAYERMRIIDEVTLKELAAVDPQVAAIVEQTNTALAEIDKRKQAREDAAEAAEIASLRERLANEELADEERARIEARIEAIEDANLEEQILLERNNAIKAAKMDTYYKDEISKVESNAADKISKLEENKNEEIKLVEEQLDEELALLEEQRLEKISMMEEALSDYERHLSERKSALDTALADELQSYQKWAEEMQAISGSIGDPILQLAFAQKYNEAMEAAGQEDKKIDLPDVADSVDQSYVDRARAIATGGDIVAYASGGPILGPTLLTRLSDMKPYAIAGEAGPESVVPHGGFQTANITLNLDSRTIAQVLGARLVNDIRISQGIRS